MVALQQSTTVPGAAWLGTYVRLRHDATLAARLQGKAMLFNFRRKSMMLRSGEMSTADPKLNIEVPVQCAVLASVRPLTSACASSARCHFVDSA